MATARNEINALLMKDLYLIIEGRNRKMAAEQMTARNVAAIIGDIFTQVMSGQSSREMIFKMWPIAGEVVVMEILGGLLLWLILFWVTGME